jgi:hypothetical protein
MTTRIGMAACCVVGAALIYLALAAAQPQPQPQGQRAPPTLDERVGVLERGFASLTTRFELRETAPVAGGALEPRIADLERTLDRLSADIQRVERQADNALREASDARREAMNAERAARDAAMRAR